MAGCGRPAQELREEIVGIQFFDEQLQGRTRSVDLPGAGGEPSHRDGTKLFSPPLGLELLLGLVRRLRGDDRYC
jgi:hypothetical protein